MRLQEDEPLLLVLNLWVNDPLEQDVKTGLLTWSLRLLSLTLWFP